MLACPEMREAAVVGLPLAGGGYTLATFLSGDDALALGRGAAIPDHWRWRDSRPPSASEGQEFTLLLSIQPGALERLGMHGMQLFRDSQTPPYDGDVLLFRAGVHPQDAPSRKIGGPSSAARWSAWSWTATTSA